MANLSSINCVKNSNIFYLSNCDLVNKYNLTNLAKKPKIENIIIKLSSRNILNSIETLGKTEADSEIQIKSFFIIYILSSLIPFISFGGPVKVQDGGNGYSIKVILSNDEQIYSFLLSIFIENWNKLLAEDFSFWSKDSNRYEQSISKLRKFLVRRKLPATVFFEVDNFLNKNSFGFISKNLSLDVEFSIQNNNFKNQDTSIRLIKNIPLFWISG